MIDQVDELGARIFVGDALKTLRLLPDASYRCCITSPPYFGLRDYGTGDAQIGAEATVPEFVGKLVDVMREVRRVLSDDGTVWLNIGDTYGPGKQLLGVPWRVAFAMQDDGWILRSDVIWHKPNPMPESVRDRPTKAHEYVFLFAKNKSYHYDRMAIAEPAIYAEQHAKKATSWGTDRKHPNKANVEKYAHTGDNKTTLPGGMKNKRSVWMVPTKPYKGAHCAVFPPALIEPCVLASTVPGDTVLDPFFGAGTTGLVAEKHGRLFVGIELNPEYAELAAGRITDARPSKETFA